MPSSSPSFTGRTVERRSELRLRKPRLIPGPVDRSFQTDAQAKPARPDDGTASGASWVDGLSFFRRPEERFDRARVPDRIGAAEERLGPSADGVAQVLELEAVRISGLELDALDAGVAPHLDDGLLRVPRVVEEERALRPDRLELVALGQSGSAVEEREDVAGEAHRAGEDPVGPARPDELLAVDELRLAGDEP